MNNSLQFNCGCFGCALIFIVGQYGHTEAQMVQLPTRQAFSLGTTVVATNQGSAYAGGIGRSYESSSSRGPFSSTRSYGRNATQGNAQVRVSIIDLEELDNELALQSSPARLAWNGSNTSYASAETTNPKTDENKRAKEALEGISMVPSRPELKDHSELTINEKPSYEYLATLSHVPAPTPNSATALEDVAYYLEEARKAKDRRHWSAVEVYYLLAWKALPEHRRQAAIANWNKPKSESKEPSTKNTDKVRTDR